MSDATNTVAPQRPVPRTATAVQAAATTVAVGAMSGHQPDAAPRRAGAGLCGAAVSGGFRLIAANDDVRRNAAVLRFERHQHTKRVARVIGAAVAAFLVFIIGVAL